MDDAKMMTDAYQFRQAIEKEVVEVEDQGIRIVIGGDLKIKSVSIDESIDDHLKDTINQAIRKAQEMQVQKMKEMIDS